MEGGEQVQLLFLMWEDRPLWALLEAALNLMTIVPPALCGLGSCSYTAGSGSGDATETDAGAKATLEMVLELQEEERSPACLSKDRTYPRIFQKRTSSQAESS